MEYSKLLDSILPKLQAAPKELLSRDLPAEELGARRKSAVCIGIWKDSLTGNARVLFVRKSQDVGRHSGQFAFPGGNLEANESYSDAAIRELKEETAYQGSTKLLGFLPTIPTMTTQYLIVPCVFELDEKAAETFPLDPEIAWTFSVAVNHLTAPDAKKSVTYTLPEGGRIQASDFYISNAHLLFFKSRLENRQPDDEPIRIWGATAYLLNMLF